MKAARWAVSGWRAWVLLLALCGLVYAQPYTPGNGGYVPRGSGIVFPRIVIGQFDGTVQNDTSTGTVDGFAINPTTTTVLWKGASTLTIQSMTGCTVTGRRVKFINGNVGTSISLAFTGETGVNGTKTRAAGSSVTLNSLASSGASSIEWECDTTLGRWIGGGETTLNITGIRTFTNGGVTVTSATGVLSMNQGARVRDIATAAVLSANCTSGGGSSATTGENGYTVTVGATSVACTITPLVGYNSNTPTVTVTPYTAGEASPGVSFTGTPVTAITLGTVVGGHIYGVHVWDH